MIKKRKRNAVMKSLCKTYEKTHNEKINLLSVCSDTKYEYSEVIDICTILYGMEYLNFANDRIIEEKEYKDGYCLSRKRYPKIGERQIFVTLTKRGTCYFEVSRDEKVKFVINSIIIPIAVSLITALIIYLSQYWLPLLQTLKQAIFGA